MTKNQEKEVQRLKERKLAIEKKLAEVRRQEQTQKRKARTHSLIVIAAAIFTEEALAGLNMDLIKVADAIKSKKGREQEEVAKVAAKQVFLWKKQAGNNNGERELTETA